MYPMNHRNTIPDRWCGTGHQRFVFYQMVVCQGQGAMEIVFGSDTRHAHMELAELPLREVRVDPPCTLAFAKTCHSGRSAQGVAEGRGESEAQI